MGAAPSAEILFEAPFRPTRNSSGRVLSLIPIIPKYFPSHDSPLFEQLYEARGDPYVRYYVRDNDKKDAGYTDEDDEDDEDDDDDDGCKGRRSSDVQLDSIPLAPFNQKEYYDYWMSFFQQCPQYETNDELRHAYNAAAPEAYRVIRPVPCAVAFQYDDSSSAPEGCVSLGDTFVRVIGAIGCLLPTTHKKKKKKKKKKNDDYNNNNSSNNNNNNNNITGKNEVAPLRMLLFLRKSAGDHNMVRVTLFAAWLFYDHCVRVCKMAQTPLPAITFRGLKTNIPLLCFLREMRSRIDLLQGNRNGHCVWLDGVFLRVHITDEHARELCEALAKHYDLLLESKPRVLEVKSLPLPLANTNNNSSVVNDSISSSNNTNTLSDMEDGNVLLRTPHSYRSVKQSFELAGYIDKHGTEIPAMGRSRDEVYLVSLDTTVSVKYGRKSEESESMSSIGVHNNNNNNNNSNNNDDNDSNGTPISPKRLNVNRGDILRFEPDEPDESIPTSAPFDESRGFSHNITANPTGDFAVGTACTTTTNSTSSRYNNISNTAESNSENKEASIKAGTWRVDLNVHVENVLLALVHDECKNAREAPADDSHWVINAETGEPLCDNNFYIWRFERKGVPYFYGTVPKFANSFKKRSDSTRKQRGITPASGTPISAPKSDVKQNLQAFVLQDNGMQGTPKGGVSHLVPVLTDPNELSQTGDFQFQTINPIPDISTNNQCVNQPTTCIRYKGTEVLYQPHLSSAESATPMPVRSNTSFSVSLGGVTNTTATGNSMVCEQNNVAGVAGAVNYPVFHAVPSPPVQLIRLVHPVETPFVSPVPCIAYVQPSQPLPIMQPPPHSVPQPQPPHLTPAPPVCGFINTLLTYPGIQPF